MSACVPVCPSATSVRTASFTLGVRSKGDCAAQKRRLYATLTEVKLSSLSGREICVKPIEQSFLGGGHVPWLDVAWHAGTSGKHYRLKRQALT